MDIALSVATLLGGITAMLALWSYISSKLMAPKYFRPENRDQFYEYYAKQIRKAKSSIYITSDGFNMANTESRRFAKLMQSAFFEAMSKGVKVYRFQVTSTMHLNWLDELKSTKSKFPDGFFVYVNNTQRNVPNVCVIDPDAANCVSERMEHSLGHPGQSTMPHTFVFFHRDKVQAQKTKQLVEELIQHTRSVELTSPQSFDQIHEFLTGERLNIAKVALKSGRSPSEDGIFEEEILCALKRDEYDD